MGYRTRWDSDDIEEFEHAFKEATKNAREIHFNLKGVDVDRTWVDAKDILPQAARKKEIVTEWELRKVIEDRDLLDKSIFFLNDRSISGKDYEEFYEFLIEISR